MNSWTGAEWPAGRVTQPTGTAVAPDRLDPARRATCLFRCIKYLILDSNRFAAGWSCDFHSLDDEGQFEVIIKFEGRSFPDFYGSTPEQHSHKSVDSYQAGTGNEVVICSLVRFDFMVPIDQEDSFRFGQQDGFSQIIFLKTDQGIEAGVEHFTHFFSIEVHVQDLWGGADGS